jgi:hypothetical protein
MPPPYVSEGLHVYLFWVVLLNRDACNYARLLGWRLERGFIFLISRTFFLLIMNALLCKRFNNPIVTPSVHAYDIYAASL